MGEAQSEQLLAQRLLAAERKFNATVAESNKNHVASLQVHVDDLRADKAQLLAEKEKAIAKLENDHERALAAKDRTMSKLENDHERTLADKDKAMSKLENDHVNAIAEFRTDKHDLEMKLEAAKNSVVEQHKKAADAAARAERFCSQAESLSAEVTGLKRKAERTDAEVNKMRGDVAAARAATTDAERRLQRAEATNKELKKKLPLPCAHFTDADVGASGYYSAQRDKQPVLLKGTITKFVAYTVPVLEVTEESGAKTTHTMKNTFAFTSRAGESPAPRRRGA